MSDWLFDLGNSRFKAAPRLTASAVGEVLAWPHGADALASEKLGPMAGGLGI